ncbi:HvfX family Cu-binding RiPP maturation protein [Pseudomonas fluorescens]|uniref:HvfX family Cu-binding RiPP maturation protein n=1 Tax=Pseudomonas fluorescens TaxID=294 RepID=UPI001A9F6500|nr:DoxX family protein [Pseudomonas fluorescens]QTD31487.1 DoxX family protein [Pseudomonas fluorescens]
MRKLFDCLYRLLNAARRLDFLAPLALRLYLVPVFWMAGTHKLADMPGTIEWFADPDWGLGLPFPTLLAWMAALTETVGALLLLAGLAVRWISVPLMITMLVAIFAVHWPNGWQAIADAGAPFANEQVLAAGPKLEQARQILQTYGDYDWLTASGNFAIINNGIEFAATYLIMLLCLFFMGAGAGFSIDYWLATLLRKPMVWSKSL